MEVDDVIAHAIYDPAARRKRYLQSRQLKGRKPPVGPVHIQTVDGRREVDGGTRIRNQSLPTGHVNRTAVSQAASNARQVAAIRGRLSDLKAHLSELLAKKKQEATSSSSSDSSKKTPSSNSKPKTAKQKAAAKKALKEAQKQRAKEPKKQQGGTSLTLDEQITKARSVITDVETKLRAAIDSARTQTASNGR